MSVQAFNPTDLSQSATNWAVAQRIVGPFAPHAQVSPDMTIQLDPGHLLNGTTLTEVTAQIVGPFTTPTSGFRVDRVVVDRATGAASIVAGAADSLTPPAIPAGSLPVARVFLENTSAAITNEAVVDERAFSDSATIDNAQITCRATLGGTSQTAVPNGTFVKVALNSVDFNIGNAFDTTNKWFKPHIAGFYQINSRIGIYATAGSNVACIVYKNGVQISWYCSCPGSSNYQFIGGSDVIYMNGTSDYLELYGIHNNGSNSAFEGSAYGTFLTAHRIA